MPDNDFAQELLFSAKELYEDLELIMFPKVKQEDLTAALITIRECCLNIVVGIRGHAKNRKNSGLYLAAIRERDRLMAHYGLTPSHIRDFQLLDELRLRVELMHLPPKTRLKYYYRQVESR